MAHMDTDGKESAWCTSGVYTFQPAKEWFKMPYVWNSVECSGNQESDKYVQKIPDTFTAESSFSNLIHQQLSSSSTDMFDLNTTVNSQKGSVHHYQPIKSTSFENDYKCARSIPQQSILGGTSIKFQPIIECEDMKNEVSWTPKLRYQNITTMQEYENKSPEELRLEDYAVSRTSPCQKMNPIHSLQKNGLSLFNTLLSNADNRFQFSSTAENVKNESDDTFFGNSSLLLETLLNNIKHRLNLHDISNETRSICEKLTNKLAKFTEKTIENLTIIILEDLLKSMKCKVKTNTKIDKNMNRRSYSNECGQKWSNEKFKKRNYKKNYACRDIFGKTKCENYGSSEFDTDFAHNENYNKISSRDYYKKKYPILPNHCDKLKHSKCNYYADEQRQRKYFPDVMIAATTTHRRRRTQDCDECKLKYERRKNEKINSNEKHKISSKCAVIKQFSNIGRHAEKKTTKCSDSDPGNNDDRTDVDTYSNSDTSTTSELKNKYVICDLLQSLSTELDENFKDEKIEKNNSRTKDYVKRTNCLSHDEHATDEGSCSEKNTKNKYKSETNEKLHRDEFSYSSSV